MFDVMVCSLFMVMEFADYDAILMKLMYFQYI